MKTLLVLSYAGSALSFGAFAFLVDNEVAAIARAAEQLGGARISSGVLSRRSPDPHLCAPQRECSTSRRASARFRHRRSPLASCVPVVALARLACGLPPSSSRIV